MGYSKQYNVSSKFTDCKTRINELDQENISLSERMYSDGFGAIDRDHMDALKNNNKEMYALRMEIKKMDSHATKIQSIARGGMARKGFSHKVAKCSNSISQSIVR